MIRPTDIGIPGLVSYSFNLTPVHGGSTTDGGMLFNISLRFDSAGVYRLRFLEFDIDGLPRTYYSDLSSAHHAWANISNEGVPNTITVTK